MAPFVMKQFIGQKGPMSTGADGDDPQPIRIIQPLSTTDLHATITSEKSLQKCEKKVRVMQVNRGRKKLQVNCGAAVEPRWR